MICGFMILNCIITVTDYLHSSFGSVQSFIFGICMLKLLLSNIYFNQHLVARRVLHVFLRCYCMSCNVISQFSTYIDIFVYVIVTSRSSSVADHIKTTAVVEK